jgi:hypothetical protein
MGKNRILSVVLVIVMCSSCQFNQSVNTDLSTGAYSRGDGIGCDDVFIEINGIVEKRNEYVFGEKVNLIFNNISGLISLENKTYPGLSIHIVPVAQDTKGF